jgi:hypothetical protein
MARLPAVHAAVAILVVKIEHALVDLDLGERRGVVGGRSHRQILVHL